MITHEVEGLLTEKIAENCFSEALLKLLEDQELAKKLGANARRKAVREYSNKVVAGRMEEIYQS